MKNDKLSFILGILGIIFLLSLIILPPLFRYLYPEKNELNANIEMNKTEEYLKNMSCNKEEIDNNIVYNFQIFTNDNKVEMLALTKTINNFSSDTDTSLYESRVSKYESTSIHYSYNINDTTLIENYRIGIPSSELPIIIENIDFTDNYKNLVNELENNGYICE